MSACCLNGCDDHGDDFAGFGLKVGQARLLHDVGTCEDLEPVKDFVALFEDDAHFGDEIGTGFCAARGPVVGADGSTAANELTGDDIGSAGLGQRLRETKNAQSQSQGAFFHIVKWHREIVEFFRGKFNLLGHSAFCIQHSAIEIGRN